MKKSKHIKISNAVLTTMEFTHPDLEDIDEIKSLLKLTFKNQPFEMWLFFPEKAPILLVKEFVEKIPGGWPDLLNELTRITEEQRIREEIKKRVSCLMSTISEAVKELGMSWGEVAFVNLKRVPQLQELISLLVQKGFTEADFNFLSDERFGDTP